MADNPQDPSEKASSESEQSPKKSKKTPPQDSSSSKEESESESESEKSKKTPPQDSSSSKEESESESESDSRSGCATQEPNAKPMDNPQKSVPKPNSGVGAKRPAEKEAEDGEAKKSKSSKKKPEKKSETTNQGMKRQLFERLWSEKDEIAILNGMIDYRLQKKSDAVADLNNFREFIKKSLQVDVSKTQLQDKIRKLKKKYENQVAKKKKAFSTPHQQKTYDLSQKIWGNKVEEVVIENNGSKKNGESKSGVKDNGVFDFLVSCGTHVDAMEKLLEKNYEVIGMEKRNEMKRKLTSLKFAEMDLCVKRSKLTHELVSLITDAMKALEN